MLILATDNIPAHCYYPQPRQLCVFLSLYLSAPLTIFPPFSVSSQTDHFLSPSRSTYNFRILFLAQINAGAPQDPPPALLSLPRLAGSAQLRRPVIYLGHAAIVCANIFIEGSA